MSDERVDLVLSMLRAISTEQSTQREKLEEIIVRLGGLSAGCRVAWRLRRFVGTARQSRSPGQSHRAAFRARRHSDSKLMFSRAAEEKV
jgi:hypothetical protein